MKEEKPLCQIGGVFVHCAHDKIVELSELKPNPKNPNKHNERQIEILAKIITEQGWRAPITVSKLSGMIVKGEGRFLAAKHMDAKAAPVDYQDYKSEESEYADLIADNKIAELSNIDNEKMAELFRDLELTDADMELTGYEDQEIEQVLLFASSEENIDDFFEETEQKEKESKQIICPHCGLPIDE